MKTYRLIETNEVIPHNELRAAFPHVSFAEGEVVEPDILEALGLEPAPDTPDASLPVPQSVTMRQARLALLVAGVLPGVDAAIASLPSPEKETAQIEWNFGGTVERASPLVTMLGQALGLDSAALDALFVQAALL